MSLLLLAPDDQLWFPCSVTNYIATPLHESANHILKLSLVKLAHLTLNWPHQPRDTILYPGDVIIRLNRHEQQVTYVNTIDIIFLFRNRPTSCVSVCELLTVQTLFAIKITSWFKFWLFATSRHGLTFWLFATDRRHRLVFQYVLKRRNIFW